MGINDLLDRVMGPGDTAPDDLSQLDGMETPDVSGPDSDDLLPPDPKPGKQRARARRAPSIAAPKATAAQKRQVEDALMLLMSVIGGGISLRDRVCGPAISANAEAVAKAAVPIIARNPAMLAWFIGGAGFMDFFALLVALQPVVGTAWAHHVSHTIGHDDQEGEARVVDYSAFSAPTL